MHIGLYSVFSSEYMFHLSLLCLYKILWGRICSLLVQCCCWNHGGRHLGCHKIHLIWHKWLEGIIRIALIHSRSFLRLRGLRVLLSFHHLLVHHHHLLLLLLLHCPHLISHNSIHIVPFLIVTITLSRIRALPRIEHLWLPHPCELLLLLDSLILGF